MYDSATTKPMEAELTDTGFRALRSREEVQQALSASGSVFVVVNSVCGCAAGGARPAAIAAVQRAQHPPKGLYTVFAGVDKEAVEEFRKHTHPYPPSSPSMALYRDGKLVFFVERLDIEGVDPAFITQSLVKAMDAPYMQAQG